MNKLLLFGVFLIGIFNTSYSQIVWQDKIDTEIYEEFSKSDLVEFIVIMEQRADVSYSKNLHTKDEKAFFVYNTLQLLMNETQQRVVSIFEDGGFLYRQHFIVNAVYGVSDFVALEKIAKLDEVKRVISNTPIYNDIPKTTSISEVLEFPNWGISKIKADSVWDMGYTGQNVVVAGADTGYDWEHPAIRDRYRGWNDGEVDHNYSWHDAIIDSTGLNDCGYNLPYPCDDYGHGTHTMGTMVGGTSEDTIGIAPGAKWICARNMNEGYGTPETYMDCFEWFIAPTDLNGENPDPEMAPHVINNSWGCIESEGCNSSNTDILEEVVSNTKASGIVVVVSAGNDGSECGTVKNPAAIYEASFSVGATRMDDTIAGFSSRGPVFVDGSNRLKPNVSAPGQGIYSSIPGGLYGIKSGTSMAGPHVTGAVALVISANPSLAGNVDLIEDILEQTADPYFSEQNCGEYGGMSIPNAVYGYGRINVLEAVKLALTITDVSNIRNNIELGLFPNPANDILRIQSILSGEYRLYVSNISGIEIIKMDDYSIGIDGGELDISKLESGVYFLSLINLEGSYFGKFIKE